MSDILIKGFIERFRVKTYDGETPLMPSLVEDGQKPDYMIISCADSRSDPGTIFDAKPGVFFGFKSIGAIVRPYKQGTALAASLQFSINALGVKKIIILGHTHCGAIKALHDQTEDPEISSFIDVAKGAMIKAKELASEMNTGDASAPLLRIAEEQVLLTSAENLKTYPSVNQALQENRLTIEPWIFDMQHGHILKHNSSSQKFEKI